MTNNTRFKIALIALIISLAVFVAFMYIPQFMALKVANFMQGFAGGIAMGAFLGVLHYGREVRRARNA